MSALRAGTPRTGATVTSSDTGAPAGARRFLLPALAALALVGGFADLIRGGITLGPILLVIACCVLIPAAILKR
ncbi:MAG TPA: hypothetical protein VGE02_09015 [Gemmatimonadales bacterium]